MSRGPYDVGDHRTPDQIRDDLFPEFDEFGEPYYPEMWEGPVTRLHKFPVVFGVRAVGTSASADTRTPDTPNSVPSPRGSLASSASDVHPPA